MPPHARRRGSMYVVVMSTAMLITLIGLASLNLARVERRSVRAVGAQAGVRLHAQSAIAMGMYWVDRNPNWRSTFPNGTWMNNKTLGSGAFTLEGIDPADKDLADSITDPLVLIGTCFQDGAQYKLRVTLNAEITGLTCLEVALHAGYDLRITSATTVQCDQIISANNDVNAFWAHVNADVEAVNIISGWTYYGLQTSPITARQMPETTAFDYYLTNGTTISYLDLPTIEIGRAIQNVLLSPMSNPYGAQTKNRQGIYVMDCGGLDVTVRNARIVGTLLLYNPGSNSKIEGSVNWTSAVSNYPALLVSGSMNFWNDAAALSETVIGVNVNPAGTPYLGSEDVDITDTYPSIIDGLVYVSGDATVQNSPVFAGSVVVGGSLTATDNLSLTYDSTFFANPPPGFETPPKMVLAPGSWLQVVD